jgi:hypothetical protein
LDFVAKRYGKTPTEMLESGSTLDIQVATIAVSYEAHVQKASKAGHTATNHSQDELQAMMDAVKGRKNDHTQSAKSN